MAGEADIKALDKRVGGIERKLDELDKSLRAAGDFKALEARVKVLEASVKALEAICKTLMEARTASKAEAAKMIADVAALNKQALTPDTVTKLMELQKKATDAQIAAQTKALQDADRAMVEKMKSDAETMTQKIVEQHFKSMVEVRLKAVEAIANAALAKK